MFYFPLIVQFLGSCFSLFWSNIEIVSHNYAVYATLNYVRLNLRERSKLFAKSIVRSEKSNSRALIQFCIIMFDDLAMI